jgi:translocation and assembly module TamB
VRLPEKAAPQIAGFNLEVQARDYDLQDLGLNLPGNVALAGQADFTGKVTGTPDAPNAVGNLGLQNLRVNGLAFEPILTGRLNYRAGQRTQLEVNGREDRIAFTLDENNRPISFFVRRDQAVASGTTQGENLIVNVRDFPVAVLRNVIPGDRLRNLGTIAGDLSGKLVIDLAQNTAESTVVGDLEIARARVGRFAADLFRGRFRYDAGAFSLTEGELQQGESRISLSGDLQAGDDRQFQFQINFDSARIENVLQALSIFGFEDLAGGLLPENLPGAEALQTISVGLPERSLLTQLRRFSEIEALLAQQRQQRKASPLPTLAELNGTLSGKIAASGALPTGQQPAFNVSFDLRGQDWVWGNYTTIDEVVAQGTYDNGVLTLLPLRVDLGEGLIALTGRLAQEQLAGQVRVEALPVSLIEPFLPPQLPVQVAGNLSALVTLAGSLENPTAIGEVALVEGTVNQQPIENAQLSFSYDDARLNFGSTVLVAQTQPVEITGSIPVALPFASVQLDSNQISIQANVQDEGLALLNLLTNQVAWVNGQGQVNVDVQGTLNQPVVTGEAVVKNATLKAEALPGPLTNVTGTVEFNGDRIVVPGITGQYNTGQITAEGTIPIFATQAARQLATNNPLTVSLNDLDVDLEGRYQGGVSGNVIITGTALSPDIGGKIRLANGQVSLGGTEDTPAAAAGTPIDSTATDSDTTDDSPIEFTNLRLILGDDVRIVRQPLLSFEAEGDLIINGTLTNPRPQGVVRLTGGQVNLFTTQFNLARGEEQTARFTPKGGLDPILDVTLVATVPETMGIGQVPTSPLSGEIRDIPATSFGTFRTVRVQAAVEGPASKLAENLELTSEPNRSEAEIVALLGGSFVNTLGRGDPALGLATIAGSTLLSNLQGDVTQLGEALGIDELRLFPTIVTDPTENVSVLGLAAEAAFDITNDFSVSLSRLFAADDPLRYNLIYRFNDQILVRASTNLSGESRLLVEYEARF